MLLEEAVKIVLSLRGEEHMFRDRRVGDGSRWSENMTFTTSQPGAATTRFFVIGDTQLSGIAESDQEEIRLMNAIAL